MTNKAYAIIGALYGDEGKGLLTDWLAATTPEAVVVRSNGGAQAGHTVLGPSGKRHVFHHVGSGTFAGAGTHFSRFFVCHPMLLLGEVEALARLGYKPRLTSDPRTMVTTPFDVMINQAIELSRGQTRHGSCGLGFGETIERNMHPAIALTTQDLFRPDLRERLLRIRDEWLPERLKRLGLAHLPDELRVALSDVTITRFRSDCADYLDRVALWPDHRLYELGTPIFEAAQGLLLDQDYGAFPHVTRSNTGLRNILAISHEADIGELDVTYATRIYTTRHGAGPLKDEVPQLSNIKVLDPTNVVNDWQGSLRLAPLDLDILRETVAADLGLNDGGVAMSAGLAVTCLDQAKAPFPVTSGGQALWLDSTEAASRISQAVGLHLRVESWGPGREDLGTPYVKRRCSAA